MTTRGDTRLDFDSDDYKVAWDSFVTAVHVWVEMRKDVIATVRDAADAFCTTDEAIRQAVSYPGRLYFIDESKQTIGVDLD